MTARRASTIAEVVFEQLRDDITTNQIRPGDRLKFIDMKRRYNVGVGPLREALFRLVGIGLVTQVGQKGFRAAPATDSDLGHIIAVRKFLELRAVLASIERGGDDWEDQVVLSYHQLSKATRRKPQSAHDYRAWERLHKNFHRALVQGCGSDWLLNAWEASFDQAERHRRLAVQQGHWLSDQKADHERLMRAAVCRDAKAMAAVLERHIGQSRARKPGKAAS